MLCNAHPCPRMQCRLPLGNNVVKSAHPEYTFDLRVSPDVETSHLFSLSGIHAACLAPAGRRKSYVCASFSLEKLDVDQCTRTYTGQQRHGWRWFQAVARFGLNFKNLYISIINLVNL